MKFFTTVGLQTSGECVVEAPSLEAAENWLANEKRDRFRNWFLDQNDTDYDTTVSSYSGMDSPDVFIDENGKEYTPARNAS